MVSVGLGIISKVGITASDPNPVVLTHCTFTQLLVSSYNIIPYLAQANNDNFRNNPL